MVKYLFLMLTFYSFVIITAQNRHKVIFTTPRGLAGTHVSILNSSKNNNEHTIVQCNTMHTSTDFSPSHIPQKPTADASSLFSWNFAKNKYALLCGMVCIGFGCIVGSFAWAHYTLNHPQAWCCWEPKQEGNITTHSADHIAPLLFDEIKNRYYKQGQTMLNVIDPILYFMHACNRELSIIEWLITGEKYCSVLRLCALLPGNVFTLEKILAYRERLLFLKQVTVQELSSYTPDARLLTHY